MSDSPTFRRRSGRGTGRPAGGYVPVDEEYLQQSGIRGGRSWCLCALIIFLLLVAVVNALVTIGLVYFLSITHEGMAAVEFLPGSRFIHLLKPDVMADSVTVHRGIVGRVNKTFMMSGEQNVLVGKVDGTHLHLNENGTVMMSEDFEVKTPSNKVLFSSNKPLDFAKHQVLNLQASQIDVGAVTSRKGVEGLHIESYRSMDVVGIEGVTIEADRDVTLRTAGVVSLLSLGGSVELQSSDGIFLSPRLPLVGDSKPVRGDIAHQQGSVGQHQLCVCASSGKVFAVPVNAHSSGCQSVDSVDNPCVN